MTQVCDERRCQHAMVLLEARLEHRLDHESTVLLRVAALRNGGVAAQPLLRWRERPGGGHDYFLDVQLPNGRVEIVQEPFVLPAVEAV